MIGRDFWDIFPLFYKKPPIPVKKIRCPVCGNNEVIWFKRASVFVRRQNEYRLDIVVKCGNCALVGRPECFSSAIPFGVHITADEYNRLIKAWKGSYIEYDKTGHVNLNELVKEG